MLYDIPYSIKDYRQCAYVFMIYTHYITEVHIITQLERKGRGSLFSLGKDKPHSLNSNWNFTYEREKNKQI